MNTFVRRGEGDGLKEPQQYYCANWTLCKLNTARFVHAEDRIVDHFVSALGQKIAELNCSSPQIRQAFKLIAAINV